MLFTERNSTPTAAGAIHRADLGDLVLRALYSPRAAGRVLTAVDPTLRDTAEDDEDDDDDDEICGDGDGGAPAVPFEL